MHLQFLGAATTVTGSQYLLTTERARILIDCGMFQGSPNESIRNRIPLAYDPAGIDAILLTHAHLDHCGLIPHVVKAGFRGPIWATKGTVELATLVLLDSGKLQEEFAKRQIRREKRRSGQGGGLRAARQRCARRGRAAGRTTGVDGTLDAADCRPRPGGGRGRVERRRRPAAGRGSGRRASPVSTIPGWIPPISAAAASMRRCIVPGAARRPAASDPVTVRARPPVAAAPPSASAGPAAGRRRGRSLHRSPATPSRRLSTSRPIVDIDLDEPLYDAQDAQAALASFRGIDYDTEIEVAPGIHATYVDAGHILGSAIIRLRVADQDGGPELRLVFSGDLGRTGTPILRDPTS